MSQRDPKTIPDGFLTLIGGQDSGKSASLIRDDQASELWNMTVRGGYPTNRPGFQKIALTFATDEIQEWFENEVHQGSIVFKPYSQLAIQVHSFGGRLFTIDVVMGGLVSEITPTLSTATTANFTVPAVGSSVAINVTDATTIYPDYPILVNGAEYMVTSISGSTLTAVNVSDTPAALVTAGATVSYLDTNARSGTKVWMQQADRFLVIQDGFSRAIIFDGGNVWRADPSRLGVPTGTVMAYGLGRLWVAINEREFVAGDIIYGPTGTSLYNYADSILKFTENTFLAEGGAFSLPFEAGKITAMDFMPVWDTSTGQGPLMIFTESSATSVNASPDRDTWKNVQSPIQAVSMRGPGPKGSWSTVPIVNGDIFFRSPDGIRSLALAIRAWGEWGSTPMSTEMDNVLVDDDEKWLFWTSAIVFDNRLLMTSGNRPGGLRPKFNGIVALDFHILSAMAGKLPPVYDGTWTGVSVWQLFKGSYDSKERAFAAVQSAEGLNELWEISRAERWDAQEGRIISTLITRNMFNKTGLNFKRLHNCEIWVDNIVGTVDFSLYYRSDQYPCWTLWNTAQVCVDFKDCTAHDNCEALAPQFRPGYKTRIGFGQPADGDENNDAKPIRIGYEFQIMLRWEGRATLRKMRIKAIDVDEQPNPDVGVVTVGCAVVDPALIPTPAPDEEPEPEPEPEVDDMPLNHAVYDATRDLIFAVRGGYVYSLNATTGAVISSERFFDNGFYDSYIAYSFSDDKLYVTAWDTDSGNEPSATRRQKWIYRINPDTLAIENSFNFQDMAFGIVDEEYFESGPRELIATNAKLFGLLFDKSQSGNGCHIYVWDVGTDTLEASSANNRSLGFSNGITFDSDNNLIWVGTQTGASSFDLAGNNTDSIAITQDTGTPQPKGLCYRSGHIYFAIYEGTLVPKYKIVKVRISDDANTVIDLVDTAANPKKIRYNSVNDRIYVPGRASDSVFIIDPNTDTIESVKGGFDTPIDVVFTPTKAWAVQHGAIGLKEIV